jgi:hypothetical protein
MKTVKYFSLLIVIVLISMIAFMGTYTKTATYPKSIPDWPGGVIKFTHTFVAATDTVYFPFSCPRPKGANDTIAYRADLFVAPGLQSGATDTVNVGWAYQWSDDNVTWSTALAVGADSATTGVTDAYNQPTQYCISKFTHGGLHPYNRIRAIGNIPAGGKLNIIGNKLLVYLLRPYDY